MQSPHSPDTAMRREIRSTLTANATASYDTVLGNWRYRQGGTVSSTEAERLQVLYAEAHAHHGGEATRRGNQPWWRFW